ncbi:MAG: tyrosine-type recombinase/integrase [Nocardioidaceae bacterium]
MRSADSSGTATTSARGAAGARVSDPAAGPHPGRSGRAHQRTAHPPGPGDGRGDDAWGLRRCEVVGLRLADLRVAERRVFVADGKGGHQRLVPISVRFFEHLAAYLDTERPADADTNADTDAVFVVLKRPRRGKSLTAAGLDEVLNGARARAGLAHATCHELRHTCLTRLREAGMPLEAVQAQAGHASIECTRIYLHLADDWLASQYRKAAEVIDAQIFADHPMSATARSIR